MPDRVPGEGPHWLLSIHEDSNANATLFKDAEPVFAVAVSACLRACRASTTV